MNANSMMNCVRCKGIVVEQISSNEVNGNIDYLGEITEAVVRKNIKTEVALAKAIDQRVIPFLKKVKRQSKYENLDLRDLINQKIDLSSKPIKHYRILNKLKLTVDKDQWVPAILEQERKLAESKKTDEELSQMSLE